MTSVRADRDRPARRKARGAFFTPQALCRHVVDWAIRTASDAVLEPSCGEAAFLVAAAERLQRLGGRARADQVVGIELHEASARGAARLLRAEGHDARIVCGDVFAQEPEPRFDAVVGNPPYVRYQDFSGEPRARARRAALRGGVALTALASSWAAFTVHASLFLRPGGRLGLVLPAELLSVNYAAEVRRFLMARFRLVRLVLFTERVFPGVQEEVVLLLAEGFGEGPTDHCELHQVRDADELDASPARATRWRPESPGGKWTPSLLAGRSLAAFEAVRSGEGFTVLEAWGDTTLGMVTGNNRFFALSPERARSLDLGPRDLVPISPPGSRHLRELSFTGRARAALGRQGRSTLLFRPCGEPSPGALRHVHSGEAVAIDQAYKCRMRAPWWLVPLVPPADLLLTYMNADTPRLCANRAGAHHLNSVHGVYLKAHLAEGGRLLPLAALNSATLVGAETVGRAYGGGMLKLEPREADRLPVPAPAALEAAAGRLRAIEPGVVRHLGAGDLMAAVGLVDEALLVRTLGVPEQDVASLRGAHVGLRARRVARGAAPRELPR